METCGNECKQEERKQSEFVGAMVPAVFLLAFLFVSLPRDDSLIGMLNAEVKLLKQLKDVDEATVNEALGLCDPVTVIWSFVKGLGRETPLDVVNGIYIATRVMGFDFPYRFGNDDPKGVACPVIRRTLAFSPQPPVINPSAASTGEVLSKYDPEDLGLMAQYLFTRDIHLFPWQAERAKRLLHNDFGVPFPGWCW